MTPEESIEQMAMLLGKGISKTQVESLVKHLKAHLTDSQIAESCERLAATWEHSWMPKPKHIIDAAPRSKQTHTTACKHCNFTGFRSVRKEGIDYAYRCSCPAGQKLSSQIPDFELTL